MVTYPPYIADVGYALVFLSFWMKMPVRLRQVAAISNVIFIIYGTLAQRYELVVLHGALLPLNVARIIELNRLQAKVRRALTSDLSVDWLRPMMQRRRFEAGTYLFRKGDDQSDIYYILSGKVRLTEIDVIVEPGQLLGEMAVFTPDSKRTLSALCDEPVELLYMPTTDFLKLYYRNPDFGIYLVRLIARRLLENIDHLQDMSAERQMRLDRLQELAKVDETTGIGDANAIYARLVAEWSRSTRTPAPLSAIVANANYEASPAELTQIAAALSWCASRATDFLGRDGREFVAILPNTDAAAAGAICREMREAVETLELSGKVAVGAATCVPAREERPYAIVLEARDAAGVAQTA